MIDREPFRPPREALEKIVYNVGYSRFSVEMNFPAVDFSDIGTIRLAENLASSLIYVRFPAYKFVDFRHKITVAVYEAVLNAQFHGNKGDLSKTINTGLWFGRQGLIFGVRDEGDYYQRSIIKPLIERKVILPSTKKNREGFGAGMHNIFQAGDPYVDNTQNALFLVCLTSKNAFAQQREKED